MNILPDGLRLPLPLRLLDLLLDFDLEFPIESCELVKN